jgi:hypothetical protein
MFAAGALALSACGAVAEDPIVKPSTSLADAVTTSSPATTVTAQPSDPETGEVQVSESLDPAGSIDGGNVGRSYIDDTFPTELSGIIGIAVADLAEVLAIDAATVAVVLVEEVVWSDASLGCPQPDMAYPQVLTDGLRIVLEADGVLYDYRSGGTSDPVLCEQAADKDKSRAGMFELTPEGEVIPVPDPPDKEVGEPTEGINPPDE